MHVCIDYRPALHEATGVGTYVRGLLHGLAETYPEDRLTAFSASMRHRLRLPDGLRVAVESEDVRFPVRLLDWLWHRRQWPPIELWVQNVDVAHSPSPMLLPARRAGTLITIHDCYFLRHPEDVGGPVRRDYVPLVARSAAAADAVLTVSETTKAEIVELLQIDPGRIHVTPLGVEPAFTAAAPPDDAERARLGVPPRYLLFVGRREPRKGLPALLEAFARVHQAMPDVELVLVGPEGLRWEETWEAAPAAAREATIILSHRGTATLARLYAGAEALLLPSLWEGFGLTGLEAQACGVPVVATRAGALPDTLGAAAEWAEVGDVDGLVEACLRVLGDPDHRARLRTAGLEHVRGFSWTQTARLTHEAYLAVSRR